MARKPSGGTNVTIDDATGRGGMIDRKKADRILDPHHYFKSKWPAKPSKLREYLKKVERERR
jgi:hypothetical protein